ncbi:MAG: DUF4422 domain-containing protein [Lachnospiraceae bacterium]|nr:DUF4422 domain-containing protein [Lachnospiraceae bacterium]
MSYYIFGAKATATGLYKALSVLRPEITIKAFLVSKQDENLNSIWGCPVRSIFDVSDGLSDVEKQQAQVFVAVPELIHTEIEAVINQCGFYNLIMIDSHLEAKIMGEYYDVEGRFRSVRKLDAVQSKPLPAVTMYQACFYLDKPLKNQPSLLEFHKTLYLGCYGAKESGVDINGKADYYDNTGDNISQLNHLRCEMTAHYWIWKNKLDTLDEYVGVCHYRRLLDLTDDDIRRIKQNDVDVVLPYPMLHYPNSQIQHTWYVEEKDWILTKKVVKELYPEYGEKFDEVFSQHYFYNYNILLAKKKVFSDYCSWLFPILDRIEKLSNPRGEERNDRYTAYLSESLETLYFMTNMNDLCIYHTGKLLFV